MPSTSTDRIDGLSTSVAVKAPVKAVSSANLTLSGEQTVNGVAVVDGDRVLVKDQNTGSENGIYVVSTGSWSRAKDFDGNRDVRKGTLVVYSGSTNIYYRVTNDDPIVIGTTEIVFQAVAASQTAESISEVLNARTAAEIAAGVSVVAFFYEEGVIDRYGTNTTPGTTDMTDAIQAALDVAHNGAGAAYGLGATYLTGTIDWPGNNITLKGAGSAYSYNTSASPKTVFRAKAATGIIFDLAQTGTAEDRTGNHLCDFEVDGNSIATVGISCAGANVIERVRVRRCTEAGIRLENFTNSTHIGSCGLTSNSGWGLHAQGVSATKFTVEESNISLNTLGGILLETGVLVNFKDCVMESNTGPGLKINRDSAHTNVFSNITFDNCWFEDNASASPYFTIVTDSELTGDTSKDIARVDFVRCRITASQATRKYMSLNYIKWVTFDTCLFGGSTETTAITLATRAAHVAFLECASDVIGSNGLTAAQLDSAIAQGTRCYSSDRDVKRTVGAGSPAAAFTNSWANNGAGYTAAAYWFDREGKVHLEGSVDTGSSGTSAFTLPVGYRPATSKVFAIDANGSHGTATIGTDGTVVLTAASTANTHLNGISFPTG